MDRKKEFVKNLKKAWRDEMLSARNYRVLAEREQHPEKKAILIRMAEAEDRHADRWAVRLRELGVEVGTFHDTPIEKLQRIVLLKSSSEDAAQMLEAGESQADALYEKMIVAAEQGGAPSPARAIASPTRCESQEGLIARWLRTVRNSRRVVPLGGALRR